MNDGTQSLSPSLILSFRDGFVFTSQPDGKAYLDSPYASFPLKRLSPGMQAVLQILGAEGGSEEQLIKLFIEKEGEAELPVLLHHLQRFVEQNLICYTVMGNQGKLATLVPISPGFQFKSGVLASDKEFVLSRFAFLHKRGKDFVLESPLTHVKIIFHSWQATALVQAWSASGSLSKLQDRLPELSDESVALLATLLWHYEFLTEVLDSGQTREDTQPTLAQWEFHDLLFHSRSRSGRNDLPYGKNYPFLEQIEPLPAIKSVPTAPAVDLYQPDIEHLKADDVPFTYIVEERCSIRQQGQPPITVRQLGEFLYRTARVKAFFEETPYSLYEITRRPYPGGGACYELELYLVVNRCEGLEPGLYYYHAREHRLYKLADRTAQVEALLMEAAYSTGLETMPQVLIVAAARFQRVAWSYQGLSYAIILKNVGVLIQTMYLVATAMKLAPCAVGRGNSDLFTQAAGTDYYAETSVGEFMLGSRADNT